MKQIILSTKGLSKKIKKEIIIDDVSISVRENSVYGLLGPNGAGKSTTLKMLVGLMKHSSGSVEFQGEVLSREHFKDIGFLIEGPSIYENLTATENLKVHTTLMKLPKSRIDEVLEIVSLLNTGNKKVANFSLGMKQRLGIAIAILNKPKLLILDEPTNGLDPLGMQQLRNLIREFPAHGITVIVSSHLLSEIELIADDIGIINNGILAYEGALNTNENLEDLFLKIVMQSEGELGEYK